MSEIALVRKISLGLEGDQILLFDENWYIDLLVSWFRRQSFDLRSHKILIYLVEQHWLQKIVL